MPELLQSIKAQSIKTKKQVVSEFRQSEIIAAARKVFAEKGYIAATVDEIAALAALAKGTIYVYFDSKEQIYNAVLENDLDALRALTLEKIAAAETAKEKISAYVNARFKYCEERRDFFRIMYIEPSGSPVLSKVKAREWLREPVRQLTAAIESAIAKKQIHAWPAETLAWTVADLTSGALQRRLSATPTTTARQDADFLIKFINAALGTTAS
ncbi:MAG TPA: TetR/AcrR family transcriptional regulator [Candidatus Angelobacter sp.]|jgi:AcrR family transcriptional regulator